MYRVISRKTSSSLYVLINFSKVFRRNCVSLIILNNLAFAWDVWPGLGINTTLGDLQLYGPYIRALLGPFLSVPLFYMPKKNLLHTNFFLFTIVFISDHFVFGVSGTNPSILLFSWSKIILHLENGEFRDNCKVSSSVFVSFPCGIFENPKYTWLSLYKVFLFLKNSGCISMPLQNVFQEFLVS